MNLITLDWAGHMSLELRDDPIGTEVGDRSFLARYFFFVIASGLLPYVEEFFRCLRYQRRHPNAPTTSTPNDQEVSS